MQNRGSKYQRTHEQIILTFIKKLETKDLKSISVKDIVEDLRIHRGTFYLHFETKYHLVEEVQNEFLESLSHQSKSFFSSDNFQSDALLVNLTNLLRYYQKNHAVFLSFIKNSSYFVNTLKYIFLQNLKKLYEDEMLNFPNEKLNYLLTYIFSAHLGIVEEWLKNDRTTPPEEIALIILSLTINCLNL
ncbi:TetR family transcriptional regulator [Siminovitchia terrae]|uniref:TetR family transcriptional regulator n=1 Tax=Siminovitchia terrae TaxID=1914933 RepID=A0ABQ4L2B5_SIMTE|nr:TetR family transcriptional regulator [Siminovitchia terrae]